MNVFDATAPNKKATWSHTGKTEKRESRQAKNISSL